MDYSCYKLHSCLTICWFIVLHWVFYGSSWTCFYYEGIKTVTKPFRLLSLNAKHDIQMSDRPSLMTQRKHSFALVLLIAGWETFHSCWVLSLEKELLQHNSSGLFLHSCQKHSVEEEAVGEDGVILNAFLISKQLVAGLISLSANFPSPQQISVCHHKARVKRAAGQTNPCLSLCLDKDLFRKSPHSVFLPEVYLHFGSHQHLSCLQCLFESFLFSKKKMFGQYWFVSWPINISRQAAG